MIVKDESAVIERCLASVKPFIDYWVIVDTGSKDGTQKIIKEFMKDIPGELHERPWVNFAYNRNEALDLARNKAKYCFFIDADEELKVSAEFSMPTLEKECYFIPTEDLSHCTFQRIHLVKNSIDWHWYGVIHEYIDSGHLVSSEILKGIYNLATASDGNRSKDLQKHQKDAEVLEKALQNDPENSRYIFYLAQTYFNCKKFEDAIQFYRKRAQMGGTGEESFCSLYMIGKIMQLMKRPNEEVMKSYAEAYAFRPTRAEPLYRIARLYLSTKNYLFAYALLTLAASIPTPNDLLFVEKDIYDFDIDFQRAACAALIGRIGEAKSIYKGILNRKGIPIKTIENINHNLAYLSQIGLN
jgi:glycosyltransferase involved in cell wall biosynthesis